MMYSFWWEPTLTPNRILIHLFYIILWFSSISNPIPISNTSYMLYVKSWGYLWSYTLAHLGL